MLVLGLERQERAVDLLGLIRRWRHSRWSGHSSGRHLLLGDLLSLCTWSLRLRARDHRVEQRHERGLYRVVQCLCLAGLTRRASKVPEYREDVSHHLRVA